MKRPFATARPRLARGCRLSDADGQQSMLMMPEGALRLNESGRRIIELCTGENTLTEILDALKKVFLAVEPERIEEDATRFLERLHEKRAVDFE